ncbi:unnamed protein product [Amaranthus hypochondriacus]
MASQPFSSMALFLCLNLLFFTMVSSTYDANCGCSSPPSTPKTPTHHPPKPPKTPKTPKTPVHPPSTKAKCPIDALKLGVCANVLGDLLGAVVGTPPKSPCCPLIQGLADLEAALCLCTAIKANVLGIHLNVPVSLSVLLNFCGKKAPSGFQCP